MTLRRSLLIITSTFNMIAAIFSLMAFITTYPTIALTYFFISLPITLYCLFSSPNKVMDSNFTDLDKDFLNTLVEKAAS